MRRLLRGANLIAGCLEQNAFCSSIFDNCCSGARGYMSEPIDKFSHFDLASLSWTDGYKLLASVILPRPIAWVVTRAIDETGKNGLNAAPFSFFNIISADPPLVAISFTKAPDREGKDTLATSVSDINL